MGMHDIALKLREIRRTKGLGQMEVGASLGISASEVSRIERGRRRLPVHLLPQWCTALGVQAELIFWDLDVAAGGGLEALSGSLDEQCQTILRQVAAGLPHMPSPARAALSHQVRVWREESDEALKTG